LLFKNRLKTAGFFLAMAFLVKPYVAIWLPFFVKKGGIKLFWVFALVTVGGYLPYAYSLDRYAVFTNLMRQWQPGILEPAAGAAFAGLIVVALWMFKVSWSTLTLAGLGGLLASPVIYPWYGLWLWPVALLSKNKWVVVATATILILISPRV
jgi:hypothetical protein